MVAKITVPTSIGRALNYNEQKMKEGKAECIYAHNFLKDAERLNFYEKLNRFQSLISLNTRARTNAIHISLNFAVGEKLSQDMLVKVATSYMEKIGFSEQPYLVYQHLDAAHPHVHIVSTNIQKDGKRISLHNIGMNKSEAARKEIEREFKLEKASSKIQVDQSMVSPITPQKLTYGKAATKRSIMNVLDHVLTQYKYASLAELNAVLKLYNTTADRGKTDSFMFQKRGLVYRVLDENGNKIGVPIKASSIYSQPTLSYLESRFRENLLVKEAHKKTLQTSLDWILQKNFKNLQEFEKTLSREGIDLIVRQNDAGLIYGLTYVDHRTKCVFNGSDIGKKYSAKGILGTIEINHKLDQREHKLQAPLLRPTLRLRWPVEFQEKDYSLSTVELVLKPTQEYVQVPLQLTRKKKKRRNNS